MLGGGAGGGAQRGLHTRPPQQHHAAVAGAHLRRAGRLAVGRPRPPACRSSGSSRGSSAAAQAGGAAAAAPAACCPAGASCAGHPAATSAAASGSQLPPQHPPPGGPERGRRPRCLPGLGSLPPRRIACPGPRASAGQAAGPRRCASPSPSAAACATGARHAPPPSAAPTLCCSWGRGIGALVGMRGRRHAAAAAAAALLGRAAWSSSLMLACAVSHRDWRHSGSTVGIGRASLWEKRALGRRPRCPPRPPAHYYRPGLPGRDCLASGAEAKAVNRQSAKFVGRAPSRLRHGGTDPKCMGRSRVVEQDRRANKRGRCALAAPCRFDAAA